MKAPSYDDYLADLEAENALMRETLQQVNAWICRGGLDLGELVEILDAVTSGKKP